MRSHEGEWCACDAAAGCHKRQGGAHGATGVQPARALGEGMKGEGGEGTAHRGWGWVGGCARVLVTGAVRHQFGQQGGERAAFKTAHVHACTGTGTAIMCLALNQALASTAPLPGQAGPKLGHACIRPELQQPAVRQLQGAHAAVRAAARHCQRSHACSRARAGAWGTCRCAWVMRYQDARGRPRLAGQPQTRPRSRRVARGRPTQHRLHRRDTHHDTCHTTPVGMPRAQGPPTCARAVPLDKRGQRPQGRLKHRPPLGPGAQVTQVGCRGQGCEGQILSGAAAEGRAGCAGAGAAWGRWARVACGGLLSASLGEPHTCLHTHQGLARRPRCPP